MIDTLTPFVSAYRYEKAGSSLDARALRERMLDAAARRRRRRTRLVTYLVPLAAVLAGSAALAASAPARSHIASFVERVTVVALAPFTAAERPAPPRPHPAARRSPLNPAPAIPASPPPLAPAPAASPIPLPTAAPAPPNPAPALTLDPMPEIPATRAPAKSTLAPRALAPDPASTPVAPEAPGTSRSAPPSSASRPTTAPPRTSPEDIAAYRVAHRLHFGRADYERALNAWDGYLTRFPNGTFAPEARVNRAVCLAHLGNTDAARASFTAIAHARPGTPGQKQAATLLEALPPAP